MDKLIADLVANGKDINEVLDMPIYFIGQIMRDKNKPKKEKSLIAAFGG